MIDTPLIAARTTAFSGSKNALLPTPNSQVNSEKQVPEKTVIANYSARDSHTKGACC